METAKDVFFFVGSLMGIFAFLRAVTEPAFARNRERWDGLKARLTEQDLIDLQYEAYAARSIPGEKLSRIARLVEDIDQDAEELRLGPPFRSRFARHLKGISDSYRELREYVQNPYWKSAVHPDQDGPARFYDFDKSYFYHEVPNGHETYTENLDGASDAVDEMRRHYRAISVLADLHAFEAPYALLTYKKRSKLPSR